jgi:type I restriction enzyme M protein
MKKEETNDIVHYLLPKLNEIGISDKYIKVDVTTEKTGNKRGDVWISTESHDSSKFEKNIIALIEAKHRNTEIGDIDWRDAMSHGEIKSQKQGLNYYGVTNSLNTFRFYNAITDDEINLDGKVLTHLQPFEILKKIQTQCNKDNSNIIDKISLIADIHSESKFQKSLKILADIYRSCGLKKGDERIEPTVSFVILKYIGEKESLQRSLEKVVKIWSDYGKDIGNFSADFDQSRKDIFLGGYGDTYKDFKDLVNFSPKLQNDQYKAIYKELDQFHFHGCNFDVFGAIYEEFASQTKKKEFGEFYTRRHITGLVARLLLRNETTPRPLKICDPACGTGGFLTEAYKVLENNYSSNGKINQNVIKSLQNSTFWGFDNDELSVARTKLNMFLAGDGHTNIYHIKDSLVDWETNIGWSEDLFDFILANPPMGPYTGTAKVEDFSFTNESRFELLFAEKIVKATKPGQEIAIVVPDGMLEAPSRENFRIHLLEHCDIFCILSLSKFVFAPYTKEKTYILFMRKKQKENIGEKQIFPIWDFIIDYDGFANSDKRYKTKWHDDIPELEDLFNEALKLAQIYLSDQKYFKTNMDQYEREVNNREKLEGLFGQKCGFVDIKSINSANFHNLLNEFHLRPIEIPSISIHEFKEKANSIIHNVKLALQKIDDIEQFIREQ